MTLVPIVRQICPRVLLGDQAAGLCSFAPTVT